MASDADPSSGRSVDNLDDLLHDRPEDTLSLSEKEKRILELYALQQEYDLEQQILQVELSGQGADDVSSDDDVDAQLMVAERAHLDARASYLTRNRIVQNTLVTGPILKAVHSGGNSTSLEQRDVLSMLDATLSSKLASTSAALIEAELASISATDENKRLAQELLRLTEQMKKHDTRDVDDAQLRGQLGSLESNVKKTRREWRSVKSVLSAVIAGSGVEWSKDVGLRELVMDDEDEVP